MTKQQPKVVFQNYKGYIITTIYDIITKKYYSHVKKNRRSGFSIPMIKTQKSNSKKKPTEEAKKYIDDINNKGTTMLNIGEQRYDKVSYNTQRKQITKYLNR